MRRRANDGDVFKGAFTIAVIAGVPVRVHWTFLILLAWVFGAGLFRGESLVDSLVPLAFVVCIFACIVAHEFGHILVARSLGIRTRDVMLLPIGGVASLERMPEKPWHELAIAVAGPLVNIIIALALVPGVLWSGGVETLTTVRDDASGGGFIVTLAAVNVWLVVFNMIPAFPMDGGRVLRAILAMFTDRLTATRAAAMVAQVIAVGMALVGIFAGHLLLIILALFVFLGAGAEAAGTQAQEHLRGLPVSAVMVRSFRVLGEGEPLQVAVDELLANSQADFPVTRDGSVRSPVVGLLTRGDLVRALAERGPGAPVRDAMRAPCPPARADDSAWQAGQLLRGGSCPLIPVVEDGVLVGLLTGENFSEAILVRGALAQNRSTNKPVG